MADVQEFAFSKKDGGISLFPAEGEQDDYECGHCGQIFHNGAPIDRGMGCYRCLPDTDSPQAPEKKRPVEVATEPDNPNKPALSDDDVVEQLDLTIQEDSECPGDTAECRFLFYGRKLEKASYCPWLIDGVNFDRINQDAFAHRDMRTRFGNMSEADAEKLKQICLEGLKTFEDGNKETFDRVSVARILCDDLAFWDQE
jgi:hypothetical protein